MDKDINYSVLLHSFKTLYGNLIHIKAENYISLSYVATFVQEHIFKDSLPKEALLGSLKEMITMFHDDITILMNIALKLFADGFAFQKGKIFGFGPEAGEACGVLKISSLPNTMNMVDRVKHYDVDCRQTRSSSNKPK